MFLLCCYCFSLQQGLGQLLLFGLDSGQIQAKSERFRGRHESKGGRFLRREGVMKGGESMENQWLRMVNIVMNGDSLCFLVIHCD